MAGLGLILSWSGYLLFVWGYSKVKGAYSPLHLSIADLALPSHRAKYIDTMGAYHAGGTTSVVPYTTGPNNVGLPANSSTKEVAIAQATNDRDATCAQYGQNSSQCKQANQRLKNVSSS